MVTEPAKMANRCHTHPSAASVSRCERCGKPVCLACAVPIRGSVFGAECLPADLRVSAPPVDPVDGATLSIAGGAVLVALIATVLPWARFGGWLGAWSFSFGRTFAWSILVVPAAVVGCLVWLLGRRRRRIGAAAWTIAGLGGIVALGGYLSIVKPPAFERPWLGPYVALGAGLVALVAGIVSARRARLMS